MLIYSKCALMFFVDSYCSISKKVNPVRIGKGLAPHLLREKRIAPNLFLGVDDYLVSYLCYFAY